MFGLKEMSTEIQSIINTIEQTSGIDSAIFDRNYDIIASTKEYRVRKGDIVHGPSIEEVMANDNVVVNKPGHMDSCAGCRFKDNCPATIEILNSIKFEDMPIGVITLTAFSKDDHQKISQNTKIYADYVRTLSKHISDIIYQKNTKSRFEQMNTLLNQTLQVSKDPLVIVDSSGLITHVNKAARSLFSNCGLTVRSIENFFPEHLTSKIFAGMEFENKMTRIGDQLLYATNRPVLDDDTFMGTVLKFTYKDALFSSKAFKTHPVNNSALDGIIGDSQQIRMIKNRIGKIAKNTSSVLITGETGTGKGLLAKAIHEASDRSHAPFISVNCAAIPDTLLESELFGYEEGAFTGAKKGGKPGKFELAEGGTLFLDEITEMPFHMQSKLLTVLQEKSYERLGGTNTIPADVRIIATSNRDLESAIQEKTFRADLFYRLSVIPLELPPLRERTRDIKTLMDTFLKEYETIAGKAFQGYSDDVVDLLISYPWPGNIRELKNVIEYTVHMEDSAFITVDALPNKFIELSQNSRSDLTSAVSDTEKHLIQNALELYGTDVKGKKQAADHLGMGLRTLYRKIKQYEL